MRQTALRFILSAIIYYACTVCAKDIFVVPPSMVSLTSFLPPILGIMWGSVASLGVFVGQMLMDIKDFKHAAYLHDIGYSIMPYLIPIYRDALCQALTAFLPYYLWHKIFVDPSKYPFELKAELLMKFVYINFITIFSTSMLSLIATSQEEIFEIYRSLNVNYTSTLTYAGLRFINELNTTMFFATPIFILLVSFNYPFHLPSHLSDTNLIHKDNYFNENYLKPTALYVFFIALFLLIDLSGTIHNLDQMNTWLMFNSKIFTTMNITQILFTYLMLRFQHSIMNDLILLGVSTVLVSAFILGYISFISMDKLIDNRVAENLNIMSIASRERLFRSFEIIKSSVHAIHNLAIDRLESYDRFVSDMEYRDRYLKEMEQLCYPIAQNTEGCISFYLRCLSDITDANTGFYWARPSGHWEGNPTPFKSITVTNINQYQESDLGWYYIPLQRHQASCIGPYIDVNTKAHVISYSMPIYIGDRPLGIIGLDMDFGYLINEIRRMSVYKQGYIYLADRYGKILYHKDYATGTVIPQRVKRYEAETYLSNGIWIGIGVPEEKIYSDRNEMLINLIAVMLIVAVVISILIIWLSMRKITPLLTLTNEVNKISEGNLDVNLDYTSKNEIGVLLRDIREMVSKLDTYIYHDELTGLRNVAAYVRHVNKIQEQQGDINYAVIVFDVNYLKKINDFYGHEAGNALIKTAASTISNVFAGSRAYRVGGDEFTVILEGANYERREILLAEFDKQLADTEFYVEGQKFTLSIARGMAVNQGAQEYSEVFQNADDAMYANKAFIKQQAKN